MAKGYAAFFRNTNLGRPGSNTSSPSTGDGAPVFRDSPRPCGASTIPSSARSPRRSTDGSCWMGTNCSARGTILTAFGSEGVSVATFLSELIERAARGSREDVDVLLGYLTPDATLATTKFVDYALSRVENPMGIARIERFLFDGTQMQRNYCSLFFNRRGDWRLVRVAYEQGLIDEIQAYAR